MLTNQLFNHSRSSHYFLGSFLNVVLLISTLILLLVAELLYPFSAAYANAAPNNPNLCYGISDEREDGSEANTLLTIDPTNRLVNEVGLTNFDGIETIAWGPNGGLYGVHDEKMGTLDQQTGAFYPYPNVIGSISVDDKSDDKSRVLDDVDSLAFDVNNPDTMMAVHRRMNAPDLLFAINITTGALQAEYFGNTDYLVLQDVVPGAVGPLLDIDDLLFDSRNGETEAPTLLGLANNRGKDSALVKIDLTTGTFERLGTIIDQNKNKVVDDLEGIAFWHHNGSTKIIGSTGTNVEGNPLGDTLFEIHYAPNAAASERIMATELFEFDGSAIDIEGLACQATIPAPSIDIEKATNGPNQVPEDADNGPGPYIKVGDQVTWSYVVTNDGQVDLKDVVVTDDKEGAIACPTSELAVNVSMTCHHTGVSQAGNYANMSTVVGTPVDEQPNVTDSDPSHYHARIAAIDIEKATNGPNQAPQDADNPTGPRIFVGESVVWTYVVVNTGQIDLQNVQVTDDREGAIQCPQTTLAVGEAMTCTHSGIALEGQYANNSLVEGTPVDGSSIVRDEDPSHYYGAQASIDIEKYTNGSGQEPQNADVGPGPAIEPGYPVYWTYVVTNTGEVNLTNVVVTDDKVEPIFCPDVDSKTILAPGFSITCIASGVAIDGQYENIGTVVANPEGVNQIVTDADPSHYVGATADIKLEKPPVFTWHYTAENNGEMLLSNVQFHAASDVSISCPEQTTLDLGQSIICTATGPKSEYAKAVKVTAIAEDGTPVEAIVKATTLDSIGIASKLNQLPVTSFRAKNLGIKEQANWEYTVTNNGSDTLYEWTALVKMATQKDSEGQPLSCDQLPLASGQSVSCAATRSVLEQGQAQIIVVQGVTRTTDGNNDVAVRSEDVAFYRGYQEQRIDGYIYDAMQGRQILVRAASPSIPDLGGYLVELFDSSGTARPVQTTILGDYTFESLEPGDYHLRFTKDDGASWDRPNHGADDTQDSDAVGRWEPEESKARTHYFRINAGGPSFAQSWDAGIIPGAVKPPVAIERIFLPIVQH